MPKRLQALAHALIKRALVCLIFPTIENVLIRPLLAFSCGERQRRSIYVVVVVAIRKAGSRKVTAPFEKCRARCDDNDDSCTCAFSVYAMLLEFAACLIDHAPLLKLIPGISRLSRESCVCV